MQKKKQRYYRIGQVSEIIGVEPHVLRFWERQFKQIKPKRIAKQRLYRAKDLDTLKRIKELLYNEGYTIAGAKKKLQEEEECMANQGLLPISSGPEPIELLQEIRDELLEIKKILQD